MLKTVPAFDRIGEENAFAVLARANALAAQGRDIINLGIGQPDFRTPDFIVEAAIKALRDGHHGYTPAVGIPPLREAVAADLAKRFKVEVSPDEVMILPGGKPTMFMSILMFGEPGADILYPDPGFPIYRSMIEYTGARPVPVPIREENGFAFSAEETLKLITPQTRLLIVNSPANPTGGVTPKSEVDKLVAGLEKFPDVAVMSDEIYDHMVYDGEKHVCLLSYPSIRDRLILLNGWSKTYAMTGWRLGYAIWPGKLYDYARKLAVNLHSCVNASAQYAGLAALKGPQDEVHKMVAEFDKRRKVVVEGLNRLPGVSCADPKGAFYAFPNVQRTGWKAKALAVSLLEDAGVAIIGGPDFGILGEGYVRLPTPIRPRTFCKALDRMGEFLAAGRRRSHQRRRTGSSEQRDPHCRDPCRVVVPRVTRHGRGSNCGYCAEQRSQPTNRPIAGPKENAKMSPTLRRTAPDAAIVPRLRRRRGDPVHPRQLAARMGHDARRTGCRRKSSTAPTRSASARSACRRNSAASSSTTARKCRPSRSSPRRSRAAIPGCPTSWCRTGRSRCCCATSRRATCRSAGSRASSTTRSSCSRIA